MWLSTREAAQRLGVTPSTVRCYIYRGHLYAVRHGGRLLVTRRSVETYVSLRHSGYSVVWTDQRTPVFRRWATQEPVYDCEAL